MTGSANTEMRNLTSEFSPLGNIPFKIHSIVPESSINPFGLKLILLEEASRRRSYERV
jgi:hypothetical protein